MTLKNFKETLTCLTLLLATNVFAANKGSLHVNAPESVAGAQLSAGDYTVRWEDTGPNVELRIMQGQKVVATTPAKIIPLKDNSLRDSNLVFIHVDGSRSLSEIFLSGKKFAIEIGGETTGLTGNSSK